MEIQATIDDQAQAPALVRQVEPPNRRQFVAPLIITSLIITTLADAVATFEAHWQDAASEAAQSRLIPMIKSVERELRILDDRSHLSPELERLMATQRADRIFVTGAGTADDPLRGWPLPP